MAYATPVAPRVLPKAFPITASLPTHIPAPDPVVPPSPIILNAAAVEILKESALSPYVWKGENAITLAASFSPELAQEMTDSGIEELGKSMSRIELRKFCLRSDVPLAYRAAAVLAWGFPANNRHALAIAAKNRSRKAWESRHEWLPLVERLRELSRKDAYTAFRSLRKAKKLKGIGPAFFTKLIFFFGKGDGYILDQWTAKSQQVLHDQYWVLGTDGKTTFKQSHGGGLPWLKPAGNSIHDNVTGAEYEAFCCAIEAMVSVLGVTDAEKVEMMLFSSTGAGWREFVRRKWAAE